MNLPYDYSRCNGNGSDICTTCRRREPGHETYQSYVEPLAKDEQCELLIPPAAPK